MSLRWIFAGGVDGCFIMDALFGFIHCMFNPLGLRLWHCTVWLAQCVKCMGVNSTWQVLWSAVRLFCTQHAHFFSVVQLVMESASLRYLSSLIRATVWHSVFVVGMPSQPCCCLSLSCHYQYHCTITASSQLLHALQFLMAWYSSHTEIIPHCILQHFTCSK
jgi:hypothetical protein